MSEEPKKTTAKKAPAAPTATVTAVSSPATGIGIAALIVGIVAVLSGWAPVWGLMVGAAAIVLGVIAMKKSKSNKGFGITGIVLGAIAALTSLIFSAIWVLSLIALGTAATVGGASLTGLAGAAQAANDAISSQDALAQKQIDGKKDFAMGETANFGTFSVKVNSVNANYTPSDSYSQPDAGKKYVLVNLTVSNPNDQAVDVSNYTFNLSADGVGTTAAYVTADPAFTGGNLEKNASVSGNLVFSVAQNATTLKLKYDTTAVVIKPYQLKSLTYTLAL